MKKLIVLLICAMSIMTAHCQVAVLDAGYSFGMKSRANRADFAIDYHHNHAMIGMGFNIPSAYYNTFSIGLHAGANVLWGNFMLTPFGEVSYNHETASKDSNIGVGIGAQAIMKIIYPLGFFVRYKYNLYPTMESPLSSFDTSVSTLTFGVSLIWAKKQKTPAKIIWPR